MSASIPTLVVDDEPLARRRMLRLLRADPDINIVGTFGSATEAAARAPQLSPQLMLLDIRMPELDGFELVARLAEQGLNPYVIFVTAYSDRSMDAFGVGAIDYLLKRFDDERFGRAVARAKSLIASDPATEAGAAGAARWPSLAAGRTRLLLSERGKVVVLAMRDIEFVQAAAKHVKIYASG
ncbi:MAG: response regulator transcription factor, partial [Gammaproteobacteria bacterium]